MNSIPLYDEVFPAEKHGRTSYRVKKGTLCVLRFEVCAKCVCIHCSRCTQGGGIVRKHHLIRKELRKS